MKRRIEFYADKIKSIKKTGDEKAYEVIVETRFSESGYLKCLITREKEYLIRDYIGKPMMFIVNLTTFEHGGQMRNEILIRGIREDSIPLDVSGVWE